MDYIATKWKVPKAEVARRALALLDGVCMDLAQGGKLVVMKDGQIVKEVSADGNTNAPAP